jgi:hypothetical protein
MTSPRCAHRLKCVTVAVAIIAMTAACGANGTTNNGAGTPATGAPTSGQSAQSAPTSQTAPMTGACVTACTPGTNAAPAGSAVVLPFTGLDRPVDVTVGIGGTSNDAVFVTDSGNNRVVRLAATSFTQTVPAFTGLNSPQGVAANGDDDVYVTDGNDNRLLWRRIPQSPPSPPWQAKSSAEWVGPFSGLQAPRGAVVYPGSYYVVDSGNNRVLKLEKAFTTGQ